MSFECYIYEEENLLNVNDIENTDVVHPSFVNEEVDVPTASEETYDAFSDSMDLDDLVDLDDSFSDEDRDNDYDVVVSTNTDSSFATINYESVYNGFIGEDYPIHVDEHNCIGNDELVQSNPEFI